MGFFAEGLDVGLDLGFARLRSISDADSGGQRPDDGVEQVARAAAVERADAGRSPPSRGVELGALELAALVVGLVDDHDDRRLGRAQQVRSPRRQRGSGRRQRRPGTG